MRVNIYSYGWNLIKYKFDYKDALDNWSLYADKIYISINTSEDDTLEILSSYIKEKNHNVILNKTNFDVSDPFFYGKLVNSSLQNCDGDLLIAQDFDERFLVKDKEKLLNLGDALRKNQNFYKSYFVPTIDLFGSKEKCLPEFKAKWYIHLKGLHRGAVNFGIKPDGKPDYNKTSTDELIDDKGNLVPTLRLINSLHLENIQAYVDNGMPIVYHTGYLNLNDRLDRSIWWKNYWENASGDENKHPDNMKDLANKMSIEHYLPLWKTI